MTKGETTLAAFRIPTQTLSAIRRLAHEASLKEGREIRYGELVLRVIEKHLLGGERFAKRNQSEIKKGGLE
jgi:hypothetical protein